MLRCVGNRAKSDGPRTNARVEKDVAEQAAHRLGTMAILTAATLTGLSVLQHLLQPELAAAQQTPLFRLSALFLVLASVGLAALQRSEAVPAQVLLNAGLAFEVCGAFALGAIENVMAWPDDPIRGASAVTVWIALCVLVISNKPWKSTAAALLSAAMVPAVHVLSAHIQGYAPLSWNRLAGYSLGPFFIAGWTPFLSARIHQMETELSRNKDLGSYQLEKLLGRGGMGEVWKARHRLLRRDAAVKIVIPELLARTGSQARRHVRERFELEAQTIASLRSPHTVALYDFGSSEDGSLYYAMELLYGMDAETLANQHGALPPSRVIALLIQACESLEEAHDLGLVHRDVKPSNLYVCRFGKRADFVKILDFGLVKALYDPAETRLTMQGETSGTPAFMAPEQVRGQLDIDARADVYALGCVAYFLLTGSLVFEETSALSMALAHVERTPEPPSRRAEIPIPESLDRVVMACLQKRREDRPQSAAEVAALLEACTDIPRWTQAEANEWWNLHQPEPARGALA